jgi:RNA polymerase sigma-70 factor (ECF subfamily)
MAESSPILGIEARLNALLEEYGIYLRNTIARLCPKDLGLQYSDIEQDARLRLWRALESGKEINDPASYIYRVAATATIDAVRRVKARREEQLRLEEDDDEGEPIKLVANQDDRPDRIVERKQIAQKVQSVFARLAENRRSAVVLYLEGLTTDEIARSLGWSEPKTRHLVYRGLSDLRRALRAEGIEGEID